MEYDPRKHHRRSVRLAGYDYASPGAYFVTICTRGRQLFFDDLICRTAAEACWRAIPDHAFGVTLDEWVIMPNHLHGIIVLGEIVGGDLETSKLHQGTGVQLNARTTIIGELASDTASLGDKSLYSKISPRSGSLAVIVRTYKAAVTTARHGAGDWAFAWQRGYYDHVVRNEKELQDIRRYIHNNPKQWTLDRHHPANFRRQPANWLNAELGEP